MTILVSTWGYIRDSVIFNVSYSIFSQAACFWAESQEGYRIRHMMKNTCDKNLAALLVHNITLNTIYIYVCIISNGLINWVHKMLVVARNTLHFYFSHPKTDRKDPKNYNAGSTWESLIRWEECFQ